MKRQATDPNAPKLPRGRTRKTFNWNGLPAELKGKCIQKMDFVSRMRLAGLSKTENRLVLANPYHWDTLQIRVLSQWSCFSLCVIGKSKLAKKNMQMTAEEDSERRSYDGSDCEDEETEIPEWEKRMMEFFQNSGRRKKRFEMPVETLEKKFGSILKYCVIENLNVEMIKNDLFLPFGPEHGPFRIKNFVGNCNYARIEDYVKMNSFPLEKVSITLFDDEDYNYDMSLGELVDVPQIRSAKLVKIDMSDGDLEVFAPDIFYAWIEKDIPIGQKLYCISPETYNKSAVELLAKSFEQRIVQKTTNAVRISTDNGDKHILFHLKAEKNNGRFRYTPFIVATMISSSEAIPDEYPEPEDLPDWEVPYIEWSTSGSKAYEI